MNIFSRFKSPVVIAAFVSLIAAVVMEVCGVDITEPLSHIMDGIFTILVALGIINNPTDKKHL